MDPARASSGATRNLMERSRMKEPQKDCRRIISPHIFLTDWKTMLLPEETKERLAKSKSQSAGFPTYTQIHWQRVEPYGPHRLKGNPQEARLKIKYKNKKTG